MCAYNVWTRHGKISFVQCMAKREKNQPNRKPRERKNPNQKHLLSRCLIISIRFLILFAFCFSLVSVFVHVFATAFRLLRSGWSECHYPYCSVVATTWLDVLVSEQDLVVAYYYFRFCSSFLKIVAFFSLFFLSFRFFLFSMFFSFRFVLFIVSFCVDNFSC